MRSRLIFIWALPFLKGSEAVVLSGHQILGSRYTQAGCGIFFLKCLFLLVSHLLFLKIHMLFIDMGAIFQLGSPKIV